MNRITKHMISDALVAVAILSVVVVDVPGTSASDAVKIRQPVVAGGFYPSDPDEVARMVDESLENATVLQLPTPIAIVSPHAGYVYSGHVAGHSYSLLRGHTFERVVVISPSHVESFQGASVYDGGGYATPLGVIPVDVDFAKRLAESSPRINLSGDGHDYERGQRGEHALEVQLPYLQRVLTDFRVVPIVMGEQSYETCRALGVAMANLIDGPGTIIVASSDLSHFHGYDEAVGLDAKVCGAVERWDYYSLSRNFSTRTWEACGGGPIVAAMIAAERLGANKAVVLKYANSGDVPVGDRERVVGYMSAAFVRDPDAPDFDVAIDLTVTPKERERLLALARRSVDAAVRSGKMVEADGTTGVLDDDLGAFVTLKINGQLRGCIGYVVPMKPLCETVRDVAAYAAVRDRRFDPVSKQELDQLEYEISVLSPIRRVTDIDKIVVGKHGLLMKKGDREGLLLPQVAAERGWDTETFLAQTCRKAGLPEDAWRSEQTDIFAFTAVVFDEHSLGDQ
jgi:AmmeMemoRadiSam system protein B/AmmeMemoRadiSam system protein A